MTEDESNTTVSDPLEAEAEAMQDGFEDWITSNMDDDAAETEPDQDPAEKRSMTDFHAAIGETTREAASGVMDMEDDADKLPDAAVKAGRWQPYYDGYEQGWYDADSGVMTKADEVPGDKWIGSEPFLRADTSKLIERLHKAIPSEQALEIEYKIDAGEAALSVRKMLSERDDFAHILSYFAEKDGVPQITDSDTRTQSRDSGPEVYRTDTDGNFLKDDGEWLPYEGPRGGNGWQRVDDGEVTYDDSPPGEAIDGETVIDDILGFGPDNNTVRGLVDDAVSENDLTDAEQTQLEDELAARFVSNLPVEQLDGEVSIPTYGISDLAEATEDEITDIVETIQQSEQDPAESSEPEQTPAERASEILGFEDPLNEVLDAGDTVTVDGIHMGRGITAGRSVDVEVVYVGDEYVELVTPDSRRGREVVGEVPIDDIQEVQIAGDIDYDEIFRQETADLGNAILEQFDISPGDIDVGGGVEDLVESAIEYSLGQGDYQQARAVGDFVQEREQQQIPDADEIRSLPAGERLENPIENSERTLSARDYGISGGNTTGDEMEIAEYADGSIDFLIPVDAYNRISTGVVDSPAEAVTNNVNSPKVIDALGGETATVRNTVGADGEEYIAKEGLDGETVSDFTRGVGADRQDPFAGEDELLESAARSVSGGYFVGNTDLHMSNLFVTDDDEVAVIDHDAGGYNYSGFMSPDDGVAPPQDVVNYALQGYEEVYDRIYADADRILRGEMDGLEDDVAGMSYDYMKDAAEKALYSALNRVDPNDVAPVDWENYDIDFDFSEIADKEVRLDLFDETVSAEPLTVTMASIEYQTETGETVVITDPSKIVEMLGYV